MDRSLLISRLREQEPLLREAGVRHLAIFGSRARGDEGPNSDLDVLVDVPPGGKFSLIDLVGVERTLSEITGVVSHAMMRRSVKPSLLRRIGDDIVEVF